MRKFIVSSIAGSIAACAIAAPLAAQETPQSLATGGQSTFSITPYAGYMWFGDLAEYATGTELTNDDSWIVGAQAKVRMTSRWSVVGNFGYARTNFELEEGPVLGPDVPTSGEIGYWLMDADLQYQLPFTMRNGTVSPFIQGGIGAVRYTAEADDFDADQSKTDLAFNAGIGVDIESGPIGFQIMLKDYVTSLDWDKFRDFTNQVADDEIDRSRIANNLALTAGLRINF
ncbi:MAG TPA: outer membrane beta-barrel protein [Gemmatimonadales bacterium]